MFQTLGMMLFALCGLVWHLIYAFPFLAFVGAIDILYEISIDIGEIHMYLNWQCTSFIDKYHIIVHSSVTNFQKLTVSGCTINLWHLIWVYYTFRRNGFNDIACEYFPRKSIHFRHVASFTSKHLGVHLNFNNKKKLI